MLYPLLAGAFHEDWSKGFSDQQWLAVRKSWSKHDNGSVPELITIEEDIVDGVKKKVAVITTQGNLSKSPITGVKAVDGGYVNSHRPERVGAILATKEYYASGSYEIKMKIGLTNDFKAPIGMSPVIFLFHSEIHFAGPDNPQGTQLNPFDPQYQPRFKETSNNDYYSSINAEIDGPELGVQGDFSKGAYSTYISTGDEGVTRLIVPYKTDILDDKYHTYRIEWHTGLISTSLTDKQVMPQGAYFYAYDAPDSEIQGFPVIKKPDGKWYAYVGTSVKFYLDGKLVATSKKNISPVSARLMIGGWFPSWAGTPNFEHAKISISDVKIEPYHDEGDVLYQPETNPTLGLVPLGSHS
jgi:beta-glucanase (GH16 family)